MLLQLGLCSVTTVPAPEYSTLTFRVHVRHGSEYLRDLVLETWHVAASQVLDLANQPKLAWPVMASSEDVLRGMPEVM